MSRTIVEREAETNSNGSIKKDLLFYLSQSPPAEGFEIGLKVTEGEEGHFSATISAESPGKIRPTMSFDVTRVPIIREYLRSTGALELAYKELLEDQERVRKTALESLGLANPVLSVAELAKKLNVSEEYLRVTLPLKQEIEATIVRAKRMSDA